MNANKIFSVVILILLINNSILLKSMAADANLSDDAIESGTEFIHCSPEAGVPYGWPKYHPSSSSFGGIRKKYYGWSSLDWEGAAADVRIPESK